MGRAYWRYFRRYWQRKSTALSNALVSSQLFVNCRDVCACCTLRYVVRPIAVQYIEHYALA